VSLLGAVEPVPAGSQAEAVRRLRPGEDGVVLDWRGRRSTFLPQVWAELPDAHAFLEALKRKAGLPGDAWFPDLALGRYRVAKFTDAAGRP
jgi:AMMECR1 domain-containing protein